MKAVESLELLASIVRESWTWGWNIHFALPEPQNDLPLSFRKPKTTWYLGEKKGRAREICLLCMKEQNEHMNALLKGAQ